MNVRLLIALLLLGNVAFFAWSQWIARPAGQGAVPASTAPRLVLASEAPTAAPLPSLQLEPGVSCVSLGPFVDLTDAARASAGLREAGLEPRQRATDGPVWAGYWVSLPGIAERREAAQVVEQLRKSGLGDAYAMPSEEGGMTVSLGLFSERPRALRRADEVRSLGFEPVVSERRRAGTVFWIDVDVRSAEQLPDPANFEGNAGRIFRLELQPCDLAGRSSEPIVPSGQADGVPG